MSTEETDKDAILILYSFLFSAVRRKHSTHGLECRVSHAKVSVF